MMIVPMTCHTAMIDHVEKENIPTVSQESPIRHSNPQTKGDICKGEITCLYMRVSLLYFQPRKTNLALDFDIKQDFATMVNQNCLMMLNARFEVI